MWPKVTAYARGPYSMTEGQIFSCPARPKLCLSFLSYGLFTLFMKFGKT